MEQQNQNPVVSNQNKSSILTFLIIIILALIAAALGYLVWAQKNSAQSSNASRQITELQIQVGQQVEVLHSQQEELNQLQKKLRSASGDPSLSQVAFLVNLANLNLVAGHDVESAQRLLKLAMEKVALQNNPNFADLKKSLESDVSRLSALASFNIENIILELDNINERIQTLSIMPNLEFKGGASSQAAKDAEKLPWYKRFLNSLSGLKDLFVIRHVGGNAIPLISPPEEAFLKENIQFKLLQTQWALIHQKPIIFQNNLKEVLMWVKRYFHNPQSIQPIVDALTKLQALNVKPDFPGLDNTLKILSQLKQQAPSPAPTPPDLLQAPPKAPQKAPAPVSPPKASGVEI